MTQNNNFFDTCIIGASGGIGLAFSKALLERGARVIATSRDSHNAELNALKDNYNEHLSIISLDLTNQNGIEKSFNEIYQLTDQLSLLINCTGILHDNNELKPEKRLEDVNEDILFRSFSLNSMAPLLIARYAFPLLKHNKRNVIANISARVGSISDNRIGGWYSYRASKAAQNMITKTLSIELNRRSPNTICVGLHPGTVDTKLSKPFQKHLRPGQLKTPENSANDLLKVIDKLGKEDSGKIFAWDGKEILP